MGWVGLEAARYRAVPASDYNLPPLTHHRLILFARPPQELELQYEGVTRHVPPPAGSISLVPAGSPGRVRWSGYFDSLHVYLEPELVARVAAVEFGLDPARLTPPPLDALDLPHLRAAMGAVEAELTADGAGGRLAAESLANVLAVHLIRHVLAPRRSAPGPDGALPRARLRAVLEYIEDHWGAGPSLAQMAAVARQSPYHFTRQFKAATGLPPYQFVLARRVERAKHLLQAGGDFSLAQAIVVEQLGVAWSGRLQSATARSARARVRRRPPSSRSCCGHCGRRRAPAATEPVLLCPAARSTRAECSESHLAH
jgi:AraC family transcriptional regulator